MASLYEQTVPVLIKYYGNFAGILHKGEDYATQASSPDHPTKEKLLTSRLREDMLPLTFQIQASSNSVKLLSSHVAGGAVITLEDNEATFEDLYKRIDRTIEILRSIDAEAFNKDWDKEFIFHSGKYGDFRFASKQAFVSEWVLPNFYFHMTIAYGLLRHEGVPLGKMDFTNGILQRQSSHKP